MEAYLQAIMKDGELRLAYNFGTDSSRTMDEESFRNFAEERAGQEIPEIVMVCSRNGNYDVLVDLSKRTESWIRDRKKSWARIRRARSLGLEL